MPALVAAGMDLEAVDMEPYLVYDRADRHQGTATPAMRKYDPTDGKPFFEVGEWRREPDEDVPSAYAAGEICAPTDAGDSSDESVFERPEWWPASFGVV